MSAHTALRWDLPGKDTPTERPNRARQTEQQLDEFADWINANDRGSRLEAAATDPDAHFIPEETDE